MYKELVFVAWHCKYIFYTHIAYICMVNELELFQDKHTIVLLDIYTRIIARFRELFIKHVKNAISWALFCYLKSDDFVF